MKGFLELRAVFDDPPVNGGVIDLHPPFFHEFFDMACAQRIRHVPPHAHENNLLREMGTLEAHRHRRSPSLCTIGYRERAYPKSPRMKIATEPSRLLHCGQACGGGSTDAAHRQPSHPPALGPWRLSRSIVARSAVKGKPGCTGSGTRWLALNGVSCTCRLYARTSNVSRLMTSVVL